MPKSIITKQLSLTEGQWRVLRELCIQRDWTYLLKRLESAPVISETVNPAEEPNEIDSWVIDATNEGRDVS